MKKPIVIISTIFAVFLLIYIYMFFRKVKPLKKYIISSGYGSRANFESPGQLENHFGIDLSADYGTNVYAAHSGKIEAVGVNNTAGKFVIIKGINGIKTHYYHLSNYVVKANEKVIAGDLIGYVGSTGRSTGNHLHFAVLRHEKFIDPETYINF